MLLFIFSVDNIENGSANNLLGVSVNSGEEAYVLYNDYAFRMGFSIRKSKERCKVSSKTILMKRFCCSKAGEKEKVAKKKNVIRRLMFNLVVKLLYSLMLMKMEFEL